MQQRQGQYGKPGDEPDGGRSNAYGRERQVGEKSDGPDERRHKYARDERQQLEQRAGLAKARQQEPQRHSHAGSRHQDHI